MNSAVYRLLLRLKTNLKEKTQQNVPSPHIFSETLTIQIENCERMSTYGKITVDTRDYLSLNFNIYCWSGKLLDNLEGGLNTDDAVRSATDKYAEKWGQDKIVRRLQNDCIHPCD